MEENKITVIRLPEPQEGNPTEGLQIHLDPLGRFTNTSSERLLLALGVLPTWIDYQDARSAKEQFHSHYHYGLYEMTGGKLDKRGVYRYPQDPPLFPIAKAKLRDEVIYFYQYSIVAIQQPDGSFFMTRMD